LACEDEEIWIDRKIANIFVVFEKVKYDGSAAL
jgi:hypothetical protein